MADVSQRKLLTEFEAVLRAAWGDVDPRQLPAPGTVTLASQRFAASSSTEVVLTMEFPAQDRTLLGWKHKRPARTFTAAFLVSDVALIPVVSFTAAVSQIVKTLVAGFGSAFYEYDPRIGLIVSTGTADLPKCPLFSAGRFVEPQWDDGRWDVQRPLECPCPFCKEPFTRSKPPMWAGLNVGWAHVHCWGAGLPRTPLDDWPAPNLST